jgi:hypothetical protein
LYSYIVTIPRNRFVYNDFKFIEQGHDTTFLKRMF